MIFKLLEFEIEALSVSRTKFVQTSNYRLSTKASPVPTSRKIQFEFLTHISVGDVHIRVRNSMSESSAPAITPRIRRHSEMPSSSHSRQNSGGLGVPDSPPPLPNSYSKDISYFLREFNFKSYFYLNFHVHWYLLFVSVT